MMYDAVDLFAGPGGWSLAAQRMGMSEIGIEFEKNAVATRQAAGFESVLGDIRNYGPSDFLSTGLIASPPCQTFSMAGKGAGRQALDGVLLALESLVKLGRIDWSSFADDRTGLVLEPMRWILEANDLGTPYEWIALEQVPTVQPVWDAYAEVLRVLGYSVETGKLNAEQFGVPQTRKRAILVAKLNGEAALPTPTHSRYYSHSPAKLDEGVEKWVSMAEALGWTGGDVTAVRSNYGSGGDPANRGERLIDEPAFAVTSKVDRNKWVLRNNSSANAAERDLEQPAPTLYFGQRSNYCAWESRPKAEQPDESSWVHSRPATTIVGSFKPEVVAAPGYRTTVSRQNAEGSIKVTQQEAAVLQSFPHDFPWQGCKSKQFQQIGNAIPPLLAEHILRSVSEA